MKSRHVWIKVLAVWLLVVCGLGWGQVISPVVDERGVDGGVPAAPAGYVMDEYGVFARDEGAKARISELLVDLSERRGFKVYLVVEPVLLGRTSPGLANELNSAWVPDGNGFVIVYEADTRRIGLGRRVEDYPTAGGDGVWLGANDLLVIWTRAVEGLDEEGTPTEYIELLVRRLTEEFDAYFSESAAEVPAERRLRVTLLVVAGAAVLALCGMVAVWMVRRSESKLVRGRKFPVTDVPERLGAPFGGGSVSSRRFGGGSGGSR